MKKNLNTEFAQRVFDVVRHIRAGEVLTYKQVATLAGNSRASRAVGNVLHTNLDPNIPCHRVIRSDRRIGGYNRGGWMKEMRLRDEGINIQDGKCLLLDPKIFDAHV